MENNKEVESMLVSALILNPIEVLTLFERITDAEYVSMSYQ